jgi:hypothetical protein
MVHDSNNRRTATLPQKITATRSVAQSVGECQQEYMASSIPSRVTVWR